MGNLPPSPPSLPQAHLQKKRRPNACVEGDVGDTNESKQPTVSGKLSDRGVAPVRAALGPEGSVCADQGPGQGSRLGDGERENTNSNCSAVQSSPGLLESFPFGEGTHKKDGAAVGSRGVALLMYFLN